MDAMVGEILFLDTNVLLTATDVLRPLHLEAQRIFSKAGQQGFHLALSGQILREYLAVATRSVEANGLGLTVPEAVANVERFLEFANLFEETEAVALRLRELAKNFDVRGPRLHDANIVATMLIHHIPVLVTQNSKDFRGFGGIKTLAIDDIQYS